MTTNPKNSFSTLAYTAVGGVALGTVATAGVDHLVETASAGIVSQHRIDLAALAVLLLLLALMSMFTKMLAEHRDHIKEEIREDLEAAEVDGKYFYFKKDDHAKLGSEIITRELRRASTNVRAVLSCLWGEDLELRLSLTTNLVNAAERLSSELVVILHGPISPEGITGHTLSLAEGIAAVSPSSTLISRDSIGPDFVLIDDTHLFVLSSSRTSTNGNSNTEGVLYVAETSRKKLNDKRIMGPLAKQFEQLLRTATPYERRPPGEGGATT